MIVGVDRLDHIKGLTQKLKGFDEFLDDHPELRNKVVLIQVAVPSREDVKEYQELETELSTLAGKINGKHGEAHPNPSFMRELTSRSYARGNPVAVYASLGPFHGINSAILGCRCMSPDLDPGWNELGGIRVRRLPGEDAWGSGSVGVRRGSIVHARR